MTSRLAGLPDPEIFAAIALERATGATAQAHDVQGRQGAYDFTLTYTNGRKAAVEVTSHAGAGQRQLASLLGRAKYAWPSPGRWAWTITISDPADIPHLSQIYGRVIALCERHGVTAPRALPMIMQHTDEDLIWLRASTASFTGDRDAAIEGEPGQRFARVMRKAAAGFLDETLSGLDDAVALLLASPNVERRVDKVSNAVADEHHLFVSVDFTGFPTPIAAMLMGSARQLPKASTLKLPGQLTHLWLAPRYLNELIGWTATGGWTTYDVYN